jgi:Protein of unknown function (DUF3106)
VKFRAVTLGLAALLLSGISVKPASAQGGPFWRARQARLQNIAQKEKVNPPRKNPPPPKENMVAPKSAPNARGLEGLPPKWVDNMRSMSPEEQQQFMQNNERFKNLPPERQQQIRQNLQKWNSLTPEQRQGALNAEAALEHMSPEQRQYVRNSLLPRWQAMPQPRRQVINRHLAMLSKMTPATQDAALNDPRFLEGLSPDEQSMLRDLNSLRNPTTP